MGEPGVRDDLAIVRRCIERLTRAGYVNFAKRQEAFEALDRIERRLAKCDDDVDRPGQSPSVA